MDLGPGTPTPQPLDPQPSSSPQAGASWAPSSPATTGPTSTSGAWLAGTLDKVHKCSPPSRSDHPQAPPQYHPPRTPCISFGLGLCLAVLRHTLGEAHTHVILSKGRGLVHHPRTAGICDVLVHQDPACREHPHSLERRHPAIAGGWPWRWVEPLISQAGWDGVISLSCLASNPVFCTPAKGRDRGPSTAEKGGGLGFRVYGLGFRGQWQ